MAKSKNNPKYNMQSSGKMVPKSNTKDTSLPKKELGVVSSLKNILWQKPIDLVKSLSLKGMRHKLNKK